MDDTPENIVDNPKSLAAWQREAADLRRQLADVEANEEFLTCKVNELTEALENAKLSEGYALQTVANLHKEVAELRGQIVKERADSESAIFILKGQYTGLFHDHDRLKEQLAEVTAERDRLDKLLKEIGSFLENKYKNYPPGSGERAYAKAALRREE